MLRTQPHWIITREQREQEQALYALTVCTPAHLDDVHGAFKRHIALSNKPWREVYEDLLAQSARGDYSWLAHHPYDDTFAGRSERLHLALGKSVLALADALHCGALLRWLVTSRR